MNDGLASASCGLSAMFDADAGSECGICVGCQLTLSTNERCNGCHGGWDGDALHSGCKESRQGSKWSVNRQTTDADS